MTDDQNRIVEILVKYALHEPLTPEEDRLLAVWRGRSPGHDELPEQLRDPEWIEEHRRLLRQNPAPIVPFPVSPYRIGWRKPLLAVVAVLLVVGGWMLLRPRSSSGAGGLVASGRVPAGVRAYLTREDGSLLVLDTVADNTLSYVGYKGPVLRQRLVVSPGAGAWRILLPDGSRVVLKDGSSLEFTTDLRSGRPVLEGEAWFGVSRDASRPLTLGLSGGTEVGVLGTTFAARAAGGETKVLLYSGAVRVRKGADSLLLRPGQAAVVGGSGLAARAMDDPERELAWRGRYAEEEVFDFESASLAAMLKELAGWYGVRVSNPDNIQGVAMTGKLQRSKSLEDMLKALERVEKGHARLRVNSDTIQVLPWHPGG